MKALVLAGGSGTRLRPITHTSAKQLVPVANKPVLFYGLEAIRDAGITECGIVVGDTAPAIREAVGDGSDFGLKVTYLPQHAPLGLAHAVTVGAGFLGDDDFVMYLGDNFVVGGITELVTAFRREQPDAHIMLTRVPDPRQFGVAELDAAGRVIGLEEKPAAPKSDLALVGVYLFTAAVHEAIATLTPSARGEYEITEAISGLIASGKRVTSTIISGYWKDTGNVADMLEVNRAVLETMVPEIHGSVDASSELIGRVSVGAGAKVCGSRIVGPVVIGPGTEITGSYIGPFTSVAAGCLIADSEIEYSIVLRGASIRGVRRIEASLIGHDVEVTPAPTVPKAHRLVLGDHSRVQISSLRRLSMTRILVTGGAGFIGSHYVRRLVSEGGASVTVLDALTYAGNLASLEPVRSEVTFVHGDIRDAKLLADLLPGHDVVLNFAAETHVDRSIAGAAPFVATNVAGVQTLLQASLDAGVRTVIQISTDEVYGSIESGSWDEQAPVRPNSPYSAAKAGGDLIALAYARTYGLDVRVTRCCNNYGPYQYPEKVIPLFVTNLLDGEPVPLYGDGGNIREWVHVDDHCRGIQLVLEAGEPGRIYHIGGGVSLSNKELTGLLLDACGAGWDMVRQVPDRLGHDRRYALDDSLLRSMGYQPRTGFREGLESLVMWYEKNRSWWEALRK
jgi:glucose-1-phosphate thymidylyltransferase